MLAFGVAHRASDALAVKQALETKSSGRIVAVRRALDRKLCTLRSVCISIGRFHLPLATAVLGKRDAARAFGADHLKTGWHLLFLEADTPWNRLLFDARLQARGDLPDAWQRRHVPLESAN